MGDQWVEKGPPDFWVSQLQQLIKLIIQKIYLPYNNKITLVNSKVNHSKDLFYIFDWQVNDLMKIEFRFMHWIKNISYDEI